MLKLRNLEEFLEKFSPEFGLMIFWGVLIWDYFLLVCLLWRILTIFFYYSGLKRPRKTLLKVMLKCLTKPSCELGGDKRETVWGHWEMRGHGGSYLRIEIKVKKMTKICFQTNFPKKKKKNNCDIRWIINQSYLGSDITMRNRGGGGGWCEYPVEYF